MLTLVEFKKLPLLLCLKTILLVWINRAGLEEFSFEACLKLLLLSRLLLKADVVDPLISLELLPALLLDINEPCSALPLNLPCFLISGVLGTRDMTGIGRMTVWETFV